MTDRSDGPWDAPTEHDDQHEIDADLSGEDPPTTRASESQRATARGVAIANQLAGARGQGITPSESEASARAPWPEGVPRRGVAIANQLAGARGQGITPSEREASARAPWPEGAPGRGVGQRQPAQPATRGPTSDDVVVLDRVSGNMPLEHAPRRTESAAGGIVVVATGADAERVRKLCHRHGLLVPVMTSLAAVHDAMSIVVIGEPSPPAAKRVVHVVRPTLPDGNLIDLLRALVSGYVIVDPPQPRGATNPRVSEAARRLATLTDRGAIELMTIEAIMALTAADRAHCLFHDPATGALWSEARRRDSGDDRTSMGGLVGWAAQTGQTVHASPAGDDPRWLQQLDDPDGKPQSRLLVQPIVGGDRRVHAVLVAARRWSHAAFSDAEVQALVSFAALAGPALDLVAASPAEPRKRITAGPLAAASRPQSPTDQERTKVDEGERTKLEGRGSPTSRLKPDTLDPTKVEGGNDADERSGPDERYSSESITALPSPPVPVRRSANPVSAPESTRPTTGPTRTVDKRTGPMPLRNAPDSTQPMPRREGDQRDLAVIATEEDAKRAQRLAKKHRIELSTFSKIGDAPEFYQIITVGETWAGEDHRVAYAARSTIPEDQLGDLLVGLAFERVVAPAAGLTRPQTAAEARRSQLAFTATRKLAALADLAAAEALVIATLNELLDTDRAYFWLVEPTTGALWSETRKRNTGDERRAIAGIAGWVARTGRTANVPRASADPRWLGPLDDPEGDPHSQLLMQPIVRADERVHGVLIAARRARRPGFTETEATLLARFAALIAPQLEQIAVAADSQQMLGDDTASPSAVPAAPESSLLAILRARWLYLALGVIVGLVIGLLVSS